MLEINLLPKEKRRARKRRVKGRNNFWFIPALASSLILLFALHGSLFLYLRGIRTQVADLESKYESLGPKQQRTASLAKRLQDSESRIESLKEIVEREPKWTDILSGLGKAVVANVWLFEFSDGTPQRSNILSDGASKRFFLIRGYALGGSEAATSTVARFITSLEREEDFIKHFRNIDLENMHSQTIEGEEVMMFVLRCDFKEGG